MVGFFDRDGDGDGAACDGGACILSSVVTS